MLSGGGIAAVREAKDFPIRMIEIGPGRRRHGGLVSRPARRPRSGGVVRHGRHHREDVPGRERRARPQVRFRGRPRAPLRQGLRHAAQGLGRRHDRDRRRRRIDRARRDRLGPDEGRTAQRRRQARPGLLRPRRHRADASPMPTWCSAGSIPTISSAARCTLDLDRVRGAFEQGVARELKLADAGGRARRAAHRRRDHGGGDPHAPRREGPRPAPLHAGRLRRRRTGARLEPRAAAQDAARGRAARRRRRFCAGLPGGAAGDRHGAQLRGAARAARLGRRQCTVRRDGERRPEAAGRGRRRSGRDHAAAERRHAPRRPGLRDSGSAAQPHLGRRRSRGDPRGLLRELSRALRPHREGLSGRGLELAARLRRARRGHPHRRKGRPGRPGRLRRRGAPRNARGRIRGRGRAPLRGLRPLRAALPARALRDRRWSRSGNRPAASAPTRRSASTRSSTWWSSCREHIGQTSNPLTPTLSPKGERELTGSAATSALTAGP